MRKTCLFCCCLLVAALPSFAQGYFETNFESVTQQTCPFDPTETVTFPTGWIIYQTLDGNWDGPVDVSRCISVEALPGNDIQIDLEQVNPAEPLFVRALPSELLSIGELPVNQLMAAFFIWSVSTPGLNDIVLGTGCAQDICTGVFAGIDVGVPGAMRIQTQAFSAFNSEHFCFPTEYFQGQNIREYILKVSFSPSADLTGKFLLLQGAGIYPSWIEPGLVASVDAQQWHFNAVTQEYDVNISETIQQGGWNGNYLMLYTEPTFPSVATPSYIPGTVTPPSAQQETINLIVNDWENLEIQPFTHLRGELVEGSDSLRHIVNLVNNGGNFCLNFVDLIFSGGNEYRHGKGGIIDVHNPFSCFQFRKGSALHVMDDATLHYGTGGAGMLGFCATSTIKLEKNSTLLVDCLMNIAECDDAIDPTHIYMDLPKTANLIFTENAHLTNRFSQGQQMELRVRMLGGTLDDSRLPAADRALIRRIYPDPAPAFADNFSLTPNPFQAAPVLSYLSAAADELTVTWMSPDGKLLSETHLTAQKGMNEWTLENTPTGTGLCWLRIGNGRQNATLKVVRVE